MKTTKSMSDFPGISKFSATLIFTALASGSLAFLTKGVMGTITMFFLTKFSQWLSFKGITLLNVGADIVIIESEFSEFNSAMDEALERVRKSQGKLSDAQKKEIDEKVKASFRKFISFV